jgi:YidC/Oxa1 family membrane protein insertase
MNAPVVLASVLTPFENFLRSILDWFHNTAHLPWAWAVVALTIVVRIVIVPLTVKQIHSMQSLQAHMPEMKEIQKKYKHDKQRQQQELMAFYKENQINPFASCLPILVQIPIFFTLYLVLRHFSQHPPCPGHPGKAAVFCVDRGDFAWLSHGFVPDMSAHASAHWGGFVLLAVYALSQLASTYFMSTSTDKMQRYLMMALPLLILPALINFPTGLVIYWMTTNLWTVGQGLVIRRMIPRVPAPATPRRTSRTPPREPAPERPVAKTRQQQQPVRVRRVKRKKGSKR